MQAINATRPGRPMGFVGVNYESIPGIGLRDGRAETVTKSLLNRHTLSATAVGVAFGGRGRHERPA